MTVVSMVFMVTVAGLNPLQMVLVGTVLELSGFLFEIPTGIIADVYSRRLSMIIGYIMVGLGYSILALYPSFEMILLSQLIWGAGYTFISGAAQAWISDEIGEVRANRSFIVASQFGNAGFLLGIVICILLANVDMKFPILLGSYGLVLLGIIAAFVMDEKPYQTIEGERPHSYRQMAATFGKGLTLLKSHPVIWIISIIAIFEGLYSEGFDRLSAPFLIEAFEFPVVFKLDPVMWWGVLAAGASILSLISLELIKHHVDTSNYRQLVITLSVASLILVTAMFCFVMTGSFLGAVIFYFIIFMMRSVKEPLTAAWLNQNLASDSRATVFSMQAQADAFGQIVGGPFIGVIAKYFSIKAALLLATAGLMPALILYRRALGIKQVKNSPKSGTDA